MSRGHVELDFFGLEKNGNTPSSAVTAAPLPHLNRRRSFRDISKINPEIVKSIIAKSENAKKVSTNVPGTPDGNGNGNGAAIGINNLPADLPVLQTCPFLSSEKAVGTAPMTIFYNGTVSVFDLSKDKAEDIIKFAVDKSSSKNDCEIDNSSFNKQSEDILETLNDGDLPIKRKKSLQRFFEKRKERLISVSPYSIDHVAHVYQKASV